MKTNDGIQIAARLVLTLASLACMLCSTFFLFTAFVASRQEWLVTTAALVSAIAFGWLAQCGVMLLLATRIKRL